MRQLFPKAKVCYLYYAPKVKQTIVCIFFACKIFTTDCKSIYSPEQSMPLPLVLQLVVAGLEKTTHTWLHGQQRHTGSILCMQDLHQL